MVSEYRRQVEALRPRDVESLAKFRKVLGTGFYHAVYARQPDAEQVDVTQSGHAIQRSGCRITKGFLSRKNYKYFRASKPEHREKIPYILFSPEGDQPRQVVDLVVHPGGKGALVDPSGEPAELVRRLLADGHDVLAIDCYLAGEFQSPFQQTRTPEIPNQTRTTEKPEYRTCYNHTDQARRAQDILTSIGMCTGRYRTVNLVGLGRGGLWSLMARPLAEGVGKTVVDVDAFDEENEANWTEAIVVPGIRRTGGFRAACALVAPGELMVHNTGRRFKTDWAEDAYRAAGVGGKLSIRQEPLSAREISLWLSQRR